MVSRFLVTTALEETWPDANEPVLFLGEWCCLYSRKTAWGKLDAVVASYHWDDRDKLHKDYLYLQSLYEALLNDLAAKLNAIHGVNHSVRYWRIIVGPWLGYFVQVLFDRWAMLNQVIQHNNIFRVRVVERKQEQPIPNDMDDFVGLYISDDWNEAIYGQILAWMKFPVEIIAAPKSLAIASEKIHTLNLLSRLKRILSRVTSLLCRDNEYFFISSYLPLTKDLSLQAKLGQIPKLWHTIATPIMSVDFAMRQWELVSLNNGAGFPNLLRSLISKHLPTAYLEGYLDVLTLTTKLPWPKTPKAIFTSNAWMSDDIFKVWAAQKSEFGAPIIIGQHGGNYGMAIWSFTEDHQIAIADHFLTWGWSEPRQDKIIPIGNFKNQGRKIVADKAGNILLVEMATPRFSYHMYSIPVAAGQWQNYLEDQYRFIKALPVALHDQVLVRLYTPDYGNNQKKRWEEHFPTIQLDEGLQPMAQLMSKARLYISTYNATTYLESMSFNFPTIMFWNPKHWELRGSAIPYFEQLKAVGIFHDTPESAARHMVKVWDDVSGWWDSFPVQAVRSKFCRRYSYVNENLSDELLATLRNR